MPLYDRVCPDGHQMVDLWEKIVTDPVPCKECGKVTERAWVTKSNSVISDEIVGGIDIRHGLCWDDGTPRKFYYKSEIARAAKEKGLTQTVRHVGERGSDKSKHTVAWTGIPISEEERLRAWYAHEEALRNQH